MEMISDARLLSLPFVLLASTFQYLRFAKKPMAAPFHRVSERCSRRCLVIGLVAELVVLRLLPLCQAYPMNAACLVFLYFWKETKRSKAVQPSEALACLLALSCWSLPFIDPSAGQISEDIEIEALLEAILSPGTSTYVATLLVSAILIYCVSCLCGFEHATVSCLPPAMNFGVSALLLKASAQLSWSVIFNSKISRLDLWLLLLVLVVLLLGVRSASTTPLRRAMEVHDNLSVLASYGALSGVFASLTGVLIYGELGTLELGRQAAIFLVTLLHIWGMRSLSLRGSDLRFGTSSTKEKDEEEGIEASTHIRQPEQDLIPEKEVQMAELTSSPPVSTPSAPTSTAIGSRSASSSSTSRRESNSRTPEGPIVDVTEHTHRRSVDEDALIEEQLFAKALAPLHNVVIGGFSPESGGSAELVDPSLWAGGWDQNALGEPQFDADFEEIMRRFDEDDRAVAQPITELALEASEVFGATPAPISLDAGSPTVSSLLTFDAQALLDAQPDDEDELLRSIQDIA